MKTIIVATDYSATASNALRFAAKLAQVFNANLVLFNVYHFNVHVSNSLAKPEVRDHIIKDNENRLKRLAEETALLYQLNVSWDIKTADTVEELKNYTTSHQPDLVVMGMDSNIQEYKLFGNTTTAAIRRLKCPVLVVPNDVEYKGINRVLYACEYKFLCEDNHLDLLKEITRKFTAELQVFHVETKADKRVPVTADIQISTIDKLMENIDHTYSFVDNPSIADGIIQGVEAWKADLLVMVPHKTGLWESIFKSSTTREMTLRGRVPLLILPNVSGHPV